jgi:hypothetical protein
MTGVVKQSGLGIDSGGNVWVTNRIANSAAGKAVLDDLLRTLRSKGYDDELLVRTMFSGSVTLLRPDGSEHPGSSRVATDTLQIIASSGERGLRWNSLLLVGHGCAALNLPISPPPGPRERALLRWRHSLF